MMQSTDYNLEAELITSYLLSSNVGEREKLIYAEAMRKLNIELSPYEQMLWSRMMQGKVRMAFIDAGLALKDPNNNVRRKLFTMLAILEASPNYTEYFLPKNYSFFYFFKLSFVAMRAVYRALVGVLMIKNIQRKCN